MMGGDVHLQRSFCGIHVSRSRQAQVHHRRHIIRGSTQQRHSYPERHTRTSVHGGSQAFEYVLNDRALVNGAHSLRPI